MNWLELRIPPVALALIGALGMTACAQWLPAWRLTLTGSTAVATALALVGALVVLLGVYEFRRSRTTVNPVRPGNATCVVSHGIYRVSRNPMYLGLALALLALAVYQAHALSPLWVAGFVVYMTRFQIRPEERALVSKFGAEYTSYIESVRRWI